MIQLNHRRLFKKDICGDNCEPICVSVQEIATLEHWSVHNRNISGNRWGNICVSTSLKCKTKKLLIHPLRIWTSLYIFKRGILSLGFTSELQFKDGKGSRIIIKLSKNMNILGKMNITTWEFVLIVSVQTKVLHVNMGMVQLSINIEIAGKRNTTTWTLSIIPKILPQFKQRNSK